MSKDLAKFDSLKADITLFVSPTLTLKVNDFKTSQEAIDAGKVIKNYRNDLEKKRKELTAPLNEQVKLINAYAKNVEEPLLRAEHHIKSELQRFSDEQEKIRLQKQKEAEEARREAERRAEEERQRLASELEAKKQAELEALEETQDFHSRAASLFGSEAPVTDIEAERKKIEEQAERERLEAEARLEREKLLRDAEHKQTTWDIDQQKIKNTRKTWKCEAVDLSQVPKEFLIVTLNEKAVLAAARGGVTQIPGVRIWQETSIALGSKTYVPQLALDQDETA